MTDWMRKSSLIMSEYIASITRMLTFSLKFCTAIVVLLSLELAATLLLYGAQVIAEYERLERGTKAESAPKKLRTG